MDDNYFFCSFSCSVRGPLHIVEIIKSSQKDWNIGFAFDTPLFRGAADGLINAPYFPQVLVFYLYIESPSPQTPEGPTPQTPNPINWQPQPQKPKLRPQPQNPKPT